METEVDLLRRIAEATDHGTQAVPFGQFPWEGDREDLESRLKALGERGLVDLGLAYAGNILVIRGLTIVGSERLEADARS